MKKNNNRKPDRWAIVNQSFLSAFITFSVIELTNRGAAIVDGLFVSNFLDPMAIASIGVVKCIFSLTAVIHGLIAVGMQSKCAHELGKGNAQNFNRIFSTMFYIAVVVSVICGTALFAAARPMAVILGASGKGAELADGAAEYLRGIGIGLPAIILAMVLSVACQLDSAKGRVRKTGVIGFIANGIFDYIAIKLDMGEFGIGLATSLARYCQVGYLLLHFRTKDRMLHFTKFSMKPKEIFETLSLGTERSLRSFGRVISPMIVNRIIIIYGGTIAMSAFSIQKDFMELSEIFATGLADATALQAGVYYGEMNSETIRATGKSAHRYCGIFIGAVGLLLIVLARPIAGLYVSEEGKLFNMVVYSSIIIGLYAPLNGLVRARISYLNAVKKTRNMQLMTFLSSIVYAVISAFLLGKLFGTYGVLAYNLLLNIMLIITVWVYIAVKNKKHIPTVEDYLELPESFNISPGNVISLDIRDSEDISLVAEQIQLFCKGHKADSKTGIKAALCFEELAVNIITFGFPKCKKAPCIDLRIVFANDKIVMRLRDNCPMFDVEHYIAKQIDSASDNSKLRLGLKMIGSLANDIRYVHSLENNNVIITFPMPKNEAAN